MPMIDCPDCDGTGYDLLWDWCETCGGSGDVPDDFFPEDSEELPMDKSEWDRRFAERIRAACPDSTKEVQDGIVKAELETWTADSDWADYEPEEAADENLSYWADG